MTNRPKNLSTVRTPYGIGQVTDPDRNGWVIVEYSPNKSVWIRPESVLEVVAPPPAWTTMGPMRAMVFDPEHEAYGHVHDDYEDGLR